MQCIYEKQTGFLTGLFSLYEKFSLQCCGTFSTISADRLPDDLTAFIGNIQEYAVTLSPAVQKNRLPFL